MNVWGVSMWKRTSGWFMEKSGAGGDAAVDELAM